MPDDPLWPRASQWLAGALGRAAEGAPSLTVVGTPLSISSISPSGAWQTPAAVRAALGRFSPYCAPAAVDLTETVRVRDAGDVALEGLANEAAQRSIATALADLPSTDLVVILGGDNAVTRPAMLALVPDLSSSGLLTLDAHHDVRGFHAGPTNGTPVRGLIADGLPGDAIVQVGIAAFTNSAAYRAWTDAHGINVVDVAAARAEGVGACVTRCLDELSSAGGSLYVDLDVDVLDAAFAPGCPGARPGGLTPAELHEAAFAAGRHPAVVAVDIVEVDATRDPTGVTVDNAALCLLWAAAGLASR